MIAEELVYKVQTLYHINDSSITSCVLIIRMKVLH